MCYRADRPRLRVGLRWLALLALGCVDAPAPGPEAAAPTAAEEEEGTPSSLLLAMEPDAPPAPERFAHMPHRAIECVTCHARPPGHAAHAGVACEECHARPPAPAGPVAERDCQRCHHESSGLACTRCHTGDASVLNTVAVMVRVAGAPARERAMPFAHERHSTETCRTCHQTSPALEFTRTCDSCHDRHHTVEADCTGCHTGPNRAAHDASAHRGCDGSGCHADPALPALATARQGCLVCHPEQKAHEPGRECAPCHVAAGA